MRAVLTAILVGTFLPGCGNQSTRSAAPGLGHSPTPPAVLALANAYFASLHNKQAQDRDDVISDFSRNFFSGFTMPGATMSGGTEVGRQGFLTGQEYRRANPAKLKETMEGYGYTVVQADGVWTVSFEHSGFRPDTEPTQTWWLSHFDDDHSGLPKGTKIPDAGLHIRITGYLSPSGHFGHLGGYGHELLTTTISKIGG